MTTDSEIVEAMNRAFSKSMTGDPMQAALAAATPMIEARLLGEMLEYRSQWKAPLEAFASERNITIPGMED